MSAGGERCEARECTAMPALPTERGYNWLLVSLHSAHLHSLCAAVGQSTVEVHSISGECSDYMYYSDISSLEIQRMSESQS